MIETVSSQEFYKQYAPTYYEYAERRKRYFDSVNLEIIRFLGKNTAKSLMDVGTGNGLRIKNILASYPQLTHVLLIDNCEEVLLEARGLVQGPHIAIQLADITSPAFEAGSTFDAVLSLNNVLAHVRLANISTALANIHKSLKTDGVFIFDINHRYNLKAYGLRAVRNYAFDLVLPTSTSFYARTGNIKTPVDLYAPRQMKSLLHEAGFRPEYISYINYDNGACENSFWGGQMFCIARRL